MSSHSRTKAAIQRILENTLHRPKALSNGGQNSHIPPQPSTVIASSSTKLDQSVLDFLESTAQPTYVRKKFKQLAQHQYEREVKNPEGRWRLDAGQTFVDHNRYADVIPYESTRVILGSEDEENTGPIEKNYINASYVHTPGGTRRYIATQGPLVETVDRFWKMVWENVSSTNPESVSTIVMLTQTDEAGIEKSAQYWPIGVNHEFVFPYQSDELVVKLLDQQHSQEADCTISTLQLFLRHGDGRKFTVKHLLYNGWRDMSVPFSNETFLNFFQLYWNSHTSEAAPVVHCSAGIGRTGVFIALDYLFSAVPKMTKEEILKDPVFETVDQLRHARGTMVARASQLEYIYTLFRDMVLVDEALVEGS